MTLVSGYLGILLLEGIIGAQRIAYYFLEFLIIFIVKYFPKTLLFFWAPIVFGLHGVFRCSSSSESSIEPRT